MTRGSPGTMWLVSLSAPDGQARQKGLSQIAGAALQLWAERLVLHGRAALPLQLWAEVTTALTEAHSLEAAWFAPSLMAAPSLL